MFRNWDKTSPRFGAGFSFIDDILLDMERPQGIDKLSIAIGIVVTAILASATAYLYWPQPSETSEEPPIRATGTIGDRYVDSFGFSFAIPKGWQAFIDKDTAALAVTKGGAQVKMEKFATSTLFISETDSRFVSYSYDQTADLWKSGSGNLAPLFLTQAGIPVFGAPKGYVVALTHTKYVYVYAGASAGDSDARNIAESIVLLKEEKSIYT
jgi:hypothetical protein